MKHVKNEARKGMIQRRILSVQDRLSSKMTHKRVVERAHDRLEGKVARGTASYEEWADYLRYRAELEAVSDDVHRLEGYARLGMA